jgi:hypothetical protein
MARGKAVFTLPFQAGVATGLCRKGTGRFSVRLSPALELPPNLNLFLILA